MANNGCSKCHLRRFPCTSRCLVSPGTRFGICFRLCFWVFTHALRDFVVPFTPHQTTPHLSICKIPSILHQSTSPRSPSPQQSANCLFIEITWFYELASADIPSARPKQDRRATEPVNPCAEELCISVIFVNKIADDRHLRFGRSGSAARLAMHGQADRGTSVLCLALRDASFCCLRKAFQGLRNLLLNGVSSHGYFGNISPSSIRYRFSLWYG